ncbi:MAG TPA: hypothetical protein VNJ10_09980 [Sphingomonas sp.]|nr:hypothetical protein [Sphingomonas sp.]
MIDNLALGLSHGLMMLAAYLLLKRPDLDREPDLSDRADRADRTDGTATTEKKPRPRA